MHTRQLILLLLAFLFFSSCKKEESETPLVQRDILLQTFSFLEADNPDLNDDIHLLLEGDQISGSLPVQTNMQALIPSFRLYGGEAFIGDQKIESGKTICDFSQNITFHIKGDNGESLDFKIDAIRFTGLPVFYITVEGGGSVQSTEEYMNGHISFDGAGQFDSFESNMRIRGRGNSTWYFHPKKPYQIKFEEKKSILGMPQDRRWLFLSEHSDKTLLRNAVALKMGELSNLYYTPQYQFAEVFVNGNHVGVYNITQKVEESNNRLQIGDDGYLLEIDQLYRMDDDDVYFYTSPFLICVKEPEIDSASAEYHYISDYVNDFEDVLYSEHFNNPDSGYHQYIDVESFIDWYLINEITKNQDARDYSSIFMHLIPGERLKMGPIWDFDLAYGNVYYSDCKNPTGFWVKQHAWFNLLFQDEDFKNKVKERFLYFKGQEDFLLQHIDQTAYQLRYAQGKNNDVWNVYGQWIWPNNVVFGSHQQEVDYLKDWLQQRMQWLDGAFSDM